jgi:hypothetical protein
VEPKDLRPQFLHNPLKQTVLGVDSKPKKRGRVGSYFCEEDVIWLNHFRQIIRISVMSPVSVEAAAGSRPQRLGQVIIFEGPEKSGTEPAQHP